MPNISITHMIILFVIVLLIFGPKNLPKIGQALGKGIREFKDAARGLSTEMEEDEERQRRAQSQRREIPPAETPGETVSRSADAAPKTTDSTQG
jgi:sec-independent protein translocase protein TatA